MPLWTAAGELSVYTSDEADAAYTLVLKDATLLMQLEGRQDVKISLRPAYVDALTGGILVRFKRSS